MTLSPGGSGPFCLYARFVSEGRQANGFDTGDPRYQVLDSRGFQIVGGNLRPVRDGDLAVIQAYEMFERSGEEYVPTFLTSEIGANGQPAMPPPPIRGAEIGGFDLLDDNGWDGIVDLDLCFVALATWDSSPTYVPSVHGDNRPQVFPMTSGNCDDGQVDTLCYHVPMPLRRLRLYVYEEIELGGGLTAYGQIPDGYVSGPGPIYTGEDGCASIWFNWTGVVAPDLGVTNDDFPDIIIYTEYEGGHPTVNDPYPLTGEPVFQIGATYDNIYSDYYIDAIGAATQTLYNLGHETGLFPDGTGTGGRSDQSRPAS